MSQRKLLYDRITSAAAFVSRIQRPYPALIWNTLSAVRREEIASLVRKLLATGCRYVVAAGTECERWHDIADVTFVDQFQTTAQQDANHLMTTWHTNESPEEVMFF